MSSPSAVTLTPCVNDFRRTVTLEWGGERVIGRRIVTSNRDGMPEDPRVHREHVRLVANKDSGLVTMTVLGTHGASLRRAGQAELVLPKDATADLISGDEILLVDESRCPATNSWMSDSRRYSGNRCAYRVKITSPPHTNKRAAAREPSSADQDGRRVRARGEELAFETKLASLQAELQQAQQRERAAAERASAAEAAQGAEATARHGAEQRAAAAEERAAQAETACQEAATAQEQAEAARRRAEEGAAAAQERAHTAEVARKEAETRAEAAEAKRREAETAREAAEAGLAYLEDEMNAQGGEEEAEEEGEEEARVASPPTALAQRGLMTQMLDDFGCESQVDPRQQRQERRQGQMVTFAKRLEKRLHKLYRVPESLPSLACKLRYAKEQCGMPLPLFEVANRTRQWRNISAHVTREELPETDEELVAVWGRILHLLKVEEKRLHGATNK